MKCSVAALAAMAAVNADAANLFANPGFEDPVTSDGPPFVGFWEAFAGGGTASSNNDTAIPRTGDQHLNVTIDNSPNSFAGAFQDVFVVPGAEVVFSGWALGLTDDGASNEIRIEWRDSVADVEVGRTANFPPAALNASTYTEWSITGLAPAGADTARAVYAIQSFGGPPTQTVYLDDLSITRSIPEPTSLAMIALAGLGLAARRR